MKTNITLIIAILFLGLNANFAQSSNEDCTINMSLFVEAVKGKKFNEALPYYQKAIKDCPKFNLSGLYKYGEDQ